jgi:hypothetical protein
LLFEQLTDAKDEEAAREILQESMIPFLESVACPPELVHSAVEAILSKADDAVAATSEEAVGGAKKLKQGIVNMSSTLTDQSEDDANLFMWGTGQPIKANANKQIDAYHEKTSSKDRRKQRQELEKTRRELAEQHQMEQASAKAGVSVMLVPTVKSKERDVNLQGLTLSLNNGTILLENGDLKFAYQRRYGLVSLCFQSRERNMTRFGGFNTCFFLNRLARMESVRLLFSTKSPTGKTWKDFHSIYVYSTLGRSFIQKVKIPPFCRRS